LATEASKFIATYQHKTLRLRGGVHRGGRGVKKSFARGSGWRTKLS